MNNNLIHIFYIKQTEKLSDDIFYFFLLQLPNFFQQEINAYKHWESAQASLLGKIILQYGFQKLNCNYSLNDVQIGAKDRPFISNEIDFNISHSGEYIIVAISTNAKVGIDIEKHRELNINLFRKYFDEYEWSEIQSSINSLQTFFDFWTIKESAIKCDGRGVEILSKTQIQSPKIYCDGKEFYYEQLTIHNDYSCAVCCTVDFQIQQQVIFLQDLLL